MEKVAIVALLLSIFALSASLYVLLTPMTSKGTPVLCLWGDMHPGVGPSSITIFVGNNGTGTAHNVVVIFQVVASSNGGKSMGLAFADTRNIAEMKPYYWEVISFPVTSSEFRNFEVNSTLPTVTLQIILACDELPHIVYSAFNLTTTQVANFQ
jgi:hypothetical protein